MMPKKICFGTAGNPDSFYAEGGKTSLEMPQWLSEKGLDAYEYQCGRGVKISADAANHLGENARLHRIKLSIHAPYFTNISSTDGEKIDNSIRYIMQTVEAAKNMNAERVVIHMGSAIDITRRAAMDISKKTVHRTLAQMDECGLGEIRLCPETMGKINQMGTLDEVLELCRIDERLLPTIDFGHINSRGFGALKTEEDYEAIINRIINVLGEERGKIFHSHFSKIEYTKSGEKKHLTFADTEYGPEFQPLAQVIKKMGLTPVIICESAGTQAEDAVFMKKCYKHLPRN